MNANTIRSAEKAEICESCCIRKIWGERYIDVVKGVCILLVVLFHYHVIACGSLIAQKGFRPSPFLCLAAAVIGFAYTWLTGYAGIVLWSLEYWTSTSYAASFPVMALMMYAIPSVRLRCRPLEVLGKASFDVMLAQMLVYYSFAESIYAAVSEPFLQILICALLGVAGGLALYAAEFRITRRLVRCLR